MLLYLCQVLYIDILKNIKSAHAYIAFRVFVTCGKKQTTTTFLNSKIGSTLIIPIETARKYGLDWPSDVIVEEQENGITIKQKKTKKNKKNRSMVNYEIQSH